MPPTTSRKRWRLVAAIVLCITSGSMMSWAFWDYVQQEHLIDYYSSEQVARRRAQEKTKDDRERQKKQIRSEIQRTVDQLCRLGARCYEVLKKDNNGIVDGIDLSQWRGTDRDLALLRSFLLLDDYDQLNGCMDGHDNWLTLTLGPSTTDASLTYLEELINLRNLSLRETQITDAGLERLRQLTRLRVIDLTATRTTDACLERLATFPKLGRVDVSGTAVTLPAVAQFSQLHPATDILIQFSGGGVRGADLSLGHSINDHGWPYKTDSSVSRDEILKPLTASRTFDSIDLEKSNVTDAGLKALEGQSQLKELDLRGTSISDAGLTYLRGLTQLQWLGLDDTQVTDQGAEELQRVLPHCAIIKGKRLVRPPDTTGVAPVPSR